MLPRSTVPLLTDTLTNKRLSLEELRLAFEKVYQTGDILDQKLQSLLQSAGLLITLVGITQLPQLIDQGRLFFLGLFGLALVLFGGMLLVILAAICSQDYPMPIGRTWATLQSNLFEVDANAALNQVIVDHLDSIAQCAAATSRKDRLLRLALVLFGGIVIALLLMIFIGHAIRLLPGILLSPA